MARVTTSGEHVAGLSVYDSDTYTIVLIIERDDWQLEDKKDFETCIAKALARIVHEAAAAPMVGAAWLSA